MRRRARIGLGYAVGSAVAFAAAVFGCQLIVPDDPPAFLCGSNAPGACPPNQACDLATGRCVDARDASDEESPELPDADAGPVDARADQDAGPAKLGTPCRVDSECASKLCGTSAMLTPTVTQGDGPLCTKPCCTSNDCDPGLVCFGAGTGGNYCVPQAKLGRAVPGTKPPGVSCSSNAECRSGRCEGSRCLDTCCSNANCAAPTTCRVVAVDAGVVHDTWSCAMPPGPLDAGQACTNAEQCSSYACVPVAPSGSCRTPCCGKNSCAAAGFPGQVCFNAPTNSDYFKYCAQFGGGSANGESCTTDVQCASKLCDSELRKCAETCCVDADCPPSQVCRPPATGTPFLRCVAR